MTKLLQFDFPHSGPFGDQMVDALKGLAKSIAEEPGFVWKIWTENEAENAAGGIYLFENEETAKTFLDKHTARLADLGISGVRAKMFDINETLSRLTKAPIG